MYESRFGISGPPFQLSPDPAFYFDSRGHHRARAELRAALDGDAGFVVVSGEIGAGKTTLVRTLLDEIDAVEQIAVANVVSTQLDAGELLTAACIGFGLDISDTPREELGAKLLRFLLKLDKEGRRAVLIIDEAQNLARDAFDPLMLASSKSARRMPLQVWLVGQPDLRNLVNAPELAAIRPEISVSYHLGPLEADELAPYIQHRLRTVGWSDKPHFEADAFAEIFRWSGGIPRRINLLCNRLLLSCFLTARENIDAALVTLTARDLRAEIGEAGPEPEAATTSDTTLTDVPSGHAARLRRRLEPMEPWPLLCVVDGCSDHVQASALLRAFAARHDLPAAKLVRIHANDALAMNRTLFTGVDIARSVIDLGIAANSPEPLDLEVKSVFAFVVDHLMPNAIVVFGGSEAALACASVAHAKGVPVVHIGAGLRADLPGAAIDRHRATDALADLLYTTDPPASQTLAEEGVAPERVHCVGNLLMDGMQVALRSLAVSALSEGSGGSTESYLQERTGYGLVVLTQPLNVNDRQAFGELLAMLRDLSRDLPLVWPVSPRIELQLRKYRMESIFNGPRIARVPYRPYPEYLDLLRQATCLLTDAWSAQEEATALGVPCLTLGDYPERPITASIGSNVAVGRNRAHATRAVWECIFNGGKRGRVPELWDGRTAARIAGYLAAWLPSSRPETRSTASTERSEGPLDQGV